MGFIGTTHIYDFLLYIYKKISKNKSRKEFGTGTKKSFRNAAESYRKFIWIALSLSYNY